MNQEVPCKRKKRQAQLKRERGKGLRGKGPTKQLGHPAVLLEKSHPEWGGRLIPEGKSQGKKGKTKAEGDKKNVAKGKPSKTGHAGGARTKKTTHASRRRPITSVGCKMKKNVSSSENKHYVG